MSLRHLSIIVLLFMSIQYANAQEKHTAEEHESGSGLRVAGVIGHTFINSDGMDGDLYIPSWGLDIDYWFNHTWGIGLHNDVEVENFVVVTNNNEVIERVNPLVFTLDALYHLGNGFVVSVGPGIEVEQNESFFLARIGLEYEYDLSREFYLMPTIFYDQRFDGFSTANLGLGVGYRL